MVLTSISGWVRAAKALMVAFVCATVLVVNVSPAFAFGIRGSAEPSEGTAVLDDVYQGSKQVTESQPRGMKEVQKKASEGLNGVQGAANTGKMKSPGDSPGAQTVKDDVKDAIDSVTD